MITNVRKQEEEKKKISLRNYSMLASNHKHNLP